MNKSAICKKLNCDIRSADNIFLDKELCTRIMNEQPVKRDQVTGITKNLLNKELIILYVILQCQIRIQLGHVQTSFYSIYVTFRNSAAFCDCVTGKTFFIC